MNIETQIKYLRKAYESGKKMKETGDYFFFYTPRLQLAADLGSLGIGVDFDHIVSGYRYGDVPTDKASYNYRDEHWEPGVSLAALDGEEEIGSAIWFGDRKKVNVTGLLVDDKGSDGEPLIIPLDMVEQYDFLEKC